MKTEYTPACPICAGTNVGHVATDNYFATRRSPAVFVRMECFYCEAKWTNVFTCRATLDITPGHLVEM